MHGFECNIDDKNKVKVLKDYLRYLCKIAGNYLTHDSTQVLINYINDINDID